MASIEAPARSGSRLLHPALTLRARKTPVGLVAPMWPVRGVLGLAVVLLAVSRSPPRASLARTAALLVVYVVGYVGRTRGAAGSTRSRGAGSGLVVVTEGVHSPAPLPYLLPVAAVGVAWELRPALVVATVAALGFGLATLLAGTPLAPPHD
ncbi:MAG TPA: hypothetical protein VMW49_02770 [Candidatus Dormibacteraeota bacterium]|nr:hypothetical protein [Candidatus Dormibacteraeota bacterium]